MAKRFNPILDNLPSVAIVGEREYKVNTDFRVVLSFFRLSAEDREPGEKAILTLRLFFGDSIMRDDANDLIKYVEWFVSRGDERREDPKRKGKESKVFDMTVDAGRIFSAFFQVYRINLGAGKAGMHWWTFCELLEALPEGTHLSEVVRIRSRKFEKGMTAAEKNALQKAKERYAIGEQVDPMTAMMKALRGTT